MNTAHLHLLLNHLPVIGTIFALMLLAFAWLRKSSELGKTGLGFFVALGLIGIVVYLTGEPAEELVEGLPGISETLLESHEEAALISTALLALYGLFAGYELFRFRGADRRLPRSATALALGLALVPAIAMGYTANLGGMIRHDEIRAEAPVGDNDVEAAIHLDED